MSRITCAPGWDLLHCEDRDDNGDVLRVEVTS